MITARTLPVTVLCAVAGCTTSTIKATTALHPPAALPEILVIGGITFADPLWGSYQPHVVRGLADSVQRKHLFARVRLPADGAAVPPGAVVVTGTVTKFSESSTALRWLIGSVWTLSILRTLASGTAVNVRTRPALSRTLPVASSSWVSRLSAARLFQAVTGGSIRRRIGYRER